MKVEKRRGLSIEPWDYGQNSEEEEETKETEEEQPPREVES